MEPGAVSSGPPGRGLVVLIGASGAGKSTWAAAHYAAAEIVSSDQLRGMVGSGPADLDASAEAFALLDAIVAGRLRRGLTTVIDTLGLDAERRAGYLAVARAAGLPATAVLIRADPAACRRRNSRRDRPVPAPVLAAQLKTVATVPAVLAGEGWDRILTVEPEDLALQPARSPGAAGLARSPGPAAASAATAPEPGSQVRLILQISRFPWGSDPQGWLTAVARRADELGFAGISLMDHLIQIPQVGRAWEPIPDPWVTLGLLAGLDTRLRLGTLVSPVTFRAPGIIAKAAATLDALSGGRIFLGLGAGWWEREHAAFGLPFPPAGERLDLLERGIETVRALWATGTKPYAGERVSLPETTCYPRPAGPVPIIVGGAGERRTLAIAARLADGANLPADEAALAGKLSVLRRYCAEAGRDPDAIEITVLDLPVVGVDRSDTARRVERLRGRARAATFAARHHAGTPGEHRARYRRLAQLGVRTVFVSLPDLTEPDDLDRLAPLLS